MSDITSYPKGAPVKLSTTFKDATGALTDGTVTLTIRIPAGTSDDQSDNVTHDSTGTYHCDYTPATVGEYYFRWVSSGAITAANEGQFQVLRSEV